MLMKSMLKPKSDDQTHTPQIFDLLQLSRKERELKSICRGAMRRLDQWRCQTGRKDNSLLSLYIQLEGMMLRRQAQDAVLCYRLIRKDRMKAFRDYMERLPVRNAGGLSS